MRKNMLEENEFVIIPMEGRESLICCSNYTLDMDLDVSFHHY